MLWLAEKATELGVASWQAVRFHRSHSVSPRGEGPAFAAKVRARMVSALEQSGGAWLPTVLADVDVESIRAESDTVHLVLDASGPPIVNVVGERSGDGGSVILVGPEGGIEGTELAALTAAGWRVASLGATTLRFETAGIAAIAVLRATLHRDHK
jgi:16S rRNA (uracil1498-N3)-methyltransferase